MSWNDLFTALFWYVRVSDRWLFRVVNSQRRPYSAFPALKMPARLREREEDPVSAAAAAAAGGFTF